ncbi:MAG: long-chain-fatty-acid--CoA ligase [Candidatus Helarchaeota archaeon]
MADIPQFIKDKYWLKHAPPGLDKWVDIPDDMTITQLAEYGAEKYGDLVNIDYYGKEFTFKRLTELTKKFSTGLNKIGVRKGDTVAIYLPNCPQFIISYFAILGIGAKLTAVSPLFVARELKYQVNDSEATTLIALDRFFRHVKKIRNETGLKRVILVNVEGKTPKKPEDPENGLYHFDTLMNNPPSDPIEGIKSDDIAIIQYTGGTTGDPKGAMLTHHNIVSNAHQLLLYAKEITKFYGWDRQVMVSTLPWYHIYGQTCELAVGVLVGAKAYLFPTFNPEQVLEKIQQDARGMMGVTTMFITLLNHPMTKEIDMTKFQYANVGAGALPVELAKKWENLTKSVMAEGYGLTEASPVVCINAPYGKKKLGSCGQPIPNTYVGIVNEKNEFLDLGEEGELVVSGPQVMKGYWKRPEKTEEVLFEAGGMTWLKTGDYAKLDEEGYIFLLDRMKDLIKYKGHSVYPREIEEVLYEHPAIKEVSVVGVPDPIAGETIKAFISLKDEYKGKITEQEIIDWSKEELAAYKYPRKIEFVGSFPKSAVGKILRRKLRDKE